jgi:hypothetical protein
MVPSSVQIERTGAGPALTQIAPRKDADKLADLATRHLSHWRADPHAKLADSAPE